MKNKEIEKLVKPLYKKKDSMHDFNHILRIKKEVTNLKKSYKNINNKKLNFLIYFHGLKDYIKAHKKEFDKDYVKSLLRHNKNPKEIEEKIVYDANMFDNVGKQGVKKIFVYGKHINRSETETYNYLKEILKKVKFYTKEGKRKGKIEIKITKSILRGKIKWK